MARPFRGLASTHPGIASGDVAVNLGDMATQLVETTMVAGTPGGVNIILNSLRHSNVTFIGIQAAGQSYNYSLSEVTSPSVSAYVLNVGARNDTGQPVNTNIYVKGFLVQRAQSGSRP